METVWSLEIDKILEVGDSLESNGIKNWALNKQQTVYALEKFSALNVAVLGGDVFKKVDGVYRPTYDSWSCDVIEGEQKREFVKRSIAKALNYISTYNSEYEAYFVLVPQ